MKEFNAFDLILVASLPLIAFVAASCIVGLAVTGGFLCLKDQYQDWKWKKMKRVGRCYYKPWEMK